VDGTSIFPAGIGLWRGGQPGGKAPIYFPRSPIMILLHNWGAVHELAVAHTLRWDGRADGRFGPTWNYLLRFLEASDVNQMQCFFTNVFVGLQPDQAVGRMNAGREFRRQCRAFLCKQIEIVRPRLVATLGSEPRDQCRMGKSQCPISSVALLHPSYVSRHYPVSERASIVAMESAKLRAALDALNHK
jgi:hypothetical protein